MEKIEKEKDVSTEKPEEEQKPTCQRCGGEIIYDKFGYRICPCSGHGGG